MKFAFNQSLSLFDENLIVTFHVCQSGSGQLVLSGSVLLRVSTVVALNGERPIHSGHLKILNVTFFLLFSLELISIILRLH